MTLSAGKRTMAISRCMSMEDTKILIIALLKLHKRKQFGSQLPCELFHLTWFCLDTRIFWDKRSKSICYWTLRWFLSDNNIDLWLTVVKSNGSLNLLIILYHPVDNFGLSWLEIEWIQNPDASSDHKGLLLYNNVSCFG